MRVLIISSPRAGSTSLIRALGKVCNITTYEEPFNKHWGSHYKDKYEFDTNCVVKVMSYEKAKNSNKTSVQFLTEFSKSFDHVILLDRLNYQEQLESYAFARQRRYDGGWQEPYIYDGDIDLGREDYFLTLQKENVQLISENINSDILFYENLYSENIEIVKKELEKANLILNTNRLIKELSPIHKLRRKQIFI